MAANKSAYFSFNCFSISSSATPSLFRVSIAAVISACCSGVPFAIKLALAPISIQSIINEFPVEMKLVRVRSILYLPFFAVSYMSSS